VAGVTREPDRAEHLDEPVRQRAEAELRREVDPPNLKELLVSSLASNPTTISIRRRLRAAIDGRVINPGDAGYDQARAVFYGGSDRRPVVIVRPTDASDVSQVVLLARETGLELAVRSGGHSLAGHSTTDGGIVLDLSDMKALDIDAEGRTAWAETGLTTGEYTAAVGAYGLATGFGDTGSVGIGGSATWSEGTA